MASTSSKEARTAEKIFRRVKHLRDYIQPGEIPLLAVPAIWDNGKQPQSTPCEVIVTSQRLLGYYSVNFPRKRHFLDDLSLSTITAVTLRHKTYEPLFRELMVSNAQRKVYIRATRRYIEALYAALRSTTEQHPSAVPTTFDETLPEQESPTTISTTSVYGRQDIRAPFSNSPLAMILLFVGGLALEAIGFGLWLTTQSMPLGLPLFFAGLVAVLTAIFLRRQKQP
ncbi:MAG TPA: hypothetical protein VEL69_09915 [Ktedonobacteraceae bacterium]|nr:hypothetical protein [Ktedonobacteraceae bacterium]